MGPPHRELAELRHGAANGIIDIYSPWDLSGVRYSDSQARFDDFILEALRWSQTHGCEAESDYRILETFLGSFSTACLEMLVGQAVRDQDHKLKFLVLDPFTPVGSARSNSLSGGTMARAERGLFRLLNEVLRAKGLPSEHFDEETAGIREIARRINALGAPEIELRFHSEITSGISYFFRNVLIRGTTAAGRAAWDGVWDRIVNDPERCQDRFDQLSFEFDELWENRSESLPGERHGDPNGVFICYPRQHESYARLLFDILDGHHRTGVAATAADKYLHVSLATTPPLSGNVENGASARSEIFLDTESINGGERWKEEIRSSLNDKGTMVILMGKERLTDWMLIELGHFWAANKTIIPLVIDPDRSLEELATRSGNDNGWVPPWPRVIEDDINYKFWDGSRHSETMTQVKDAILKTARRHV